MRKNFLTVTLASMAIVAFLVVLTLALSTSPLGRYTGNDLTFSYPTMWSMTIEELEYPEIYSVSGKVKTSNVKPFIDDQNLIQFNYPIQWLVKQEAFSGSEILKHIRLVSPDKKNISIIEVWKEYKPLISFINDIRVAHIRGSEAERFKVEKAIYNNYQGYIVSYKINNILCKEFYFTQDNRIYRIGYFYNGPRWTKEQENNFLSILQSLKVN